MDESTLRLWQEARRSWTCLHMQSGLGAANESRESVLADFERLWNGRSMYRIVDGPPPMPRREGEPTVAEATVTADERHRRGYSVYRELLKQHHPDTNAKRKFTGDEVTRALVELWEAVNG